LDGGGHCVKTSTISNRSLLLLSPFFSSRKIKEQKRKKLLNFELRKSKIGADRSLVEIDVMRKKAGAHQKREKQNKKRRRGRLLGHQNSSSFSSPTRDSTGKIMNADRE
jgi:hypothetical protein